MREHIISWGGTNKQTDKQTENAMFEAGLNLRLAESGAKKRHHPKPAFIPAFFFFDLLSSFPFLLLHFLKSFSSFTPSPTSSLCISSVPSSPTQLFIYHQSADLSKKLPTLAATWLIISTESGNFWASQVKYLLPLVCSISSQMTSTGMSNLSKLELTVKTSS